MKKQYTNRQGLAASLCAAVLLSVLIQVARGGSAGDFCLRLFFSGLATVFLWRCSPLIARYYFDGSGKAPYRFVLHVIFWVIAAIALFIGFKQFQ